MFEELFPILLLLVISVGLACVLVFLSVFLGRRTKLGKKGDSYECGVDPIGTTREPFPVMFYLVAILFILFDIEVVFLYPWAVISDKLGVFGFVEMLVFVAILMVGYFYILGKGALKWD